MINSLHLLGHEIPIYGLAAAIGIFVAVIYLKVNVRKRQFADLDRDLELAFLYALIGTAVGSKLLYLLIESGHIIENISKYGSIKTWYAYITGGFVFFGGFIGCIAALYIYSKRAGISFSHLLQLMLPAFPLAHAISRTGCFLTGCCYGKQAQVFFAVTYTCSNYAPNGVPLIPVQMIEAVYELLLFVLLWRDSKRSESGTKMLAEYCILYGTGRFILEFFRGDAYRGFIGPLSVSQVISLICITAGCAYILHVRQDRGRRWMN